jgi:hypothetical protein
LDRQSLPAHARSIAAISSSLSASTGFWSSLAGVISRMASASALR